MEKYRKKYLHRGLAVLLAMVCLIFTFGSGFQATVYGQTVQDNQGTDNVTYQPDQCGLEDVQFLDTEVEDDADSISTDTVYASNSEWTKYSDDYYYNQLSANEKTLYDRLEAMVIRYMDSNENISGTVQGYNCLDKVTCDDLNLTTDNAKKVAWLFYQSESQYYYLRNVISVGSKSLSVKAYNVTLTVYPEFIDGAKRQNYTTQFMNQVNTWVNQYKNYTSDYKKQKAVHDLICENVRYSYGTYDQSAISAVLNSGLFSRKTVCAGYAKTFQILCNAMGVSANIVISNSHAWNVVKIAGQWYYVDCTFDDSYYEYGLAPYLDISYKTLMAFDAEGYSSSHTSKTPWNTLVPNCTTDYNKNQKNGVVVQSNGKIVNYINGVVSTKFNGMATDESTGKRYWFDYGTVARDKEAYDPDSGAWYWFDADGTMAMNKDAFIPTNKERTQGKWVRYNATGGMVKGEDYRYGGWYWFDPTTGEMIKGFVNIPDGTAEGKWVYYDPINGQMYHGESYINNSWYRFDNVTGKMVHGEYCDQNGNWYYYDQITGIMAHGWITLPDGRTMYYDECTGVLR